MAEEESLIIIIKIVKRYLCQDNIFIKKNSKMFIKALKSEIIKKIQKSFLLLIFDFYESYKAQFLILISKIWSVLRKNLQKFKKSYLYYFKNIFLE